MGKLSNLNLFWPGGGGGGVHVKFVEFVYLSGQMSEQEFEK